jgi:hypothetical protein
MRKPMTTRFWIFKGPGPPDRRNALENSIEATQPSANALMTISR